MLPWQENRFCEQMRSTLVRDFLPRCDKMIDVPEKNNKYCLQGKIRTLNLSFLNFLSSNFLQKGVGQTFSTKNNLKRIFVILSSYQNQFVLFCYLISSNFKRLEWMKCHYIFTKITSKRTIFFLFLSSGQWSFQSI